MDQAGLQPNASRRRNGRIASCEPCRKRKMRCDHRRPICDRCRARGQQSKCCYHPAPLTRKSRSVTLSCVTGPDLLSEITTDLESGTYETRKTPDDNNGLLVRPNQYPETSINTFLNDTPEAGPYEIHTNSLGSQEHIASVAGILRHLRDFDFISDLVQSYFSATTAYFLPSTLIMDALPSLSQIAADFEILVNAAVNPAQLSCLAEDVLRSTATPVKITPSLTPAEFTAIYTGRSLRLEYLGIVFSVAGRSSLLGLAKGKEPDNTFIRSMLIASSKCLQIAREVTQINDMLVWLGQDHYMLASCLEGDASKLRQLLLNRVLTKRRRRTDLASSG